MVSLQLRVLNPVNMVLNVDQQVENPINIILKMQKQVEDWMNTHFGEIVFSSLPSLWHLQGHCLSPWEGGHEERRAFASAANP